MTSRSATFVASAIAIITTTAAPAAPLTLAEATRIDASSSPAPGEPSLAEIRQETERFRNVNVALAEGYIRDPANMCETAEMTGQPRKLGAMGLHYFRPDMLGITAPPNPRVDGTGTHTDFGKPAVLVYEPQADGSLELIAVENLVFAKAWKEAGHHAPPSFHGVPWDTMIDDPATPVDEAHNFEPHHDRHVWLYRENPNGIFAQFNPRVTCEHHNPGASHAHQHASGQ
ncbi:hypothetical protein L2449_25045 [Mesorhizobium muleiense]|jgi:hypothetical protein|uniref:hypothetical protein n=1 Tax=Mesorhizobium muleiense TaxID=1004279 RepID=UPI001F1A4E55|nr:hypothetical protein [Mesorhizobium muleiense]MCF6120107.1 hypothetical protein [Mesorhizobium muleiense]